MVQSVGAAVTSLASKQKTLPYVSHQQSVVGLRSLIKECDTWISCDSFFQHLGWDEGKKGIVLWSVSDPLIYGHPENINLLKDRKYLEENQFGRWEASSFGEEKFVQPELVYSVLTDLLSVDKSAGIKSNTGQT